MPPQRFLFNAEDYSVHWKDIGVLGKRVLDLGCDYGSTAEYFLAQGAKEVYGEDCRQDYIDYAIERNIPKFFPIPYGSNIDDLLKVIRPDVVKVDIEGNEIVLLECKCLSIASEWYIETHSEELHKQILAKFSQEFKVERDFLFVGGTMALYLTRFLICHKGGEIT